MTTTADGGTAAKTGKDQSSVFASGLALLGAAITMVATFGIARLVSPEAGVEGLTGLQLAAIFFLTTTVVSIVGTSMAFGTQVGLVYFLPRELDRPSPSPRALLWIALRPVLMASTAAALVVLLISGLLGNLFGGEQSAEVASVLRVLAIAIPAWSVTNSLLGATRGLGTVTPTVAIQQIGRPALQIIGLITLVLTDNLTPVWIGVAWGVPVLLGAAAAFSAVVALGGWRNSGPSCVASSEFWTFVRPNALSNALQIALERGDVLILGIIFSSDLVGAYGGLSRFATAGNFIAYALSQAVSPNLRKAINAEQEERVRRLFHHAAGWMIVTTWPYLLIVAIKTVPLASLLSEAYVPEARLLSFLVIGMVVSALCGPVELHLLMRGRSKTTLQTTAISLVTDIVLIVVLGKWLGIVGAAIAWAISLAGKNVINSYLSHRWYGISAASIPAALAATIAVIAVVPVGLATANDFTGLALTLGIGGVLTLAGIFFLRDELGLRELTG